MGYYDVRCAKRPPLADVPLTKSTLLQKSAVSSPWSGEVCPAGEQYVFIPPGCSLSPMLVWASLFVYFIRTWQMYGKGLLTGALSYCEIEEMIIKTFVGHSR